MKGLDLHRSFYEECGKPLLMEAFPQEFHQLAVASVGWGSDRLGADDEYSRDHCWEPGFQIFSDRLPKALLKDIEAFLFARLPWEFHGYRRSDCCGSPNTIRAWTIEEFFMSATSFAAPPSKEGQWLLITDEALSHVTNGEVFHDPTGELTKRREGFRYFPDNVWRFKLAGRAMRMEVQRYQMERCIAHGEKTAALLMMSEGLRELFHFICLINKRYAPYDRWLPWIVRRLPILAPDIAPLADAVLEMSDLVEQLAGYNAMIACCADHCYSNELAVQGQYLWADLWEMITGDLKEFPVRAWVGVEFRYASQIAIGDFRTLLAACD